MHIIDPKRFQEALRARGYSSIGEFAASIGVHRNSIHYYLSGRGVFPEVIEKILEALDTKPHEILVEKAKQSIPLEQIAPLIDQLKGEFPDVTFVLFGSRTSGRAQKYSDWDIGIYKKGGLPHEEYRRIVRCKDDLVEDMPFFVDMVNLNRADNYFVREASKNWKYLGGRLEDWVDIQRKAAA